MLTSTLALVTGVVVVLIVDAALFGILVWPAVARRWRRPPAGRGGGVPVTTRAEVAVLDNGATAVDGVPIATYHRVARFAAWAYILFTACFIAATRLWRASEPAIFSVLAVAGALVFLVHDVLPASRFRRAKYLMEGFIAVGLVTAIVLLTDGLHSPFFLAYPVIVAGAALVASPPVTFGLAALATAAYLAAPAATGSQPFDTITIAVAGINVAALALLTYVAFVIAREQRRTRSAAIRLSTTDALTGLANRAYLLAALEREIDRGTRYARGFCLLMADLDGLKTINDSHGHAAGDSALRRVADVIREGVRAVDVPARLAGDEFVVLLPETEPAGAFVVAEKIRQGVAEVSLFDRDAPFPVSISIGVVSWPEAGATVEQVMESADAAMYVSKRRGKNRVAATSTPGPDDPPRPRSERTLPESSRHDIPARPDSSRHDHNSVPIRGFRPGLFAPRTHRSADRPSEPPLATAARIVRGGRSTGSGSAGSRRSGPPSSSTPAGTA